MKLVSRLVAAWALVAGLSCAHAADLTVAVSGNFTLPPMVTEPGTFSLSLTVSEPLVGVVPQGDSAFNLLDVPVQATFNGSSVLANARQAGWFDFTDIVYRGFDIRLSNLLVPGDLMQLILIAPIDLFSGPTTAPTLQRLTLSGLQGELCYYGTGSGSCTANGAVWGASYSVAVVPEPATLLMLPAGLLLLAAAVRRRRT